jgi:hypothetical protein
VDLDTLPESSLASKISEVESAILEGKLLELNRVLGTARFTSESEGFFKAYPLQIVFHNIGWYLAYEYADGEKKGLFKFERLDRLLGNKLSEQRDRSAQEKSLKNLKILYESSGGIHLGNDPREQKLYLSSNKTEKAKVQISLELWVNNHIFSFISEGNRRFPINQMKMSPRSSKQEHKPPYTLSLTGDDNFPNRFKLTLPKWCLDDVDLFRWIIGFGGQVKVVSPPELVEKIRVTGEAITQIYQ